MATLEHCLTMYRTTDADGVERGANPEEQAAFIALREKFGGDAKGLQANLEVLNADEQSIREQLTQETEGPTLAQAQAADAGLAEDPALYQNADLTMQPPTKTVKAYKLFRIDPNRPGELFPLFLDANIALRVGEWIPARMAGDWSFQAANGHHYVPAVEFTDYRGKKRKTGSSIVIPDDATRQELISRGFLPVGSKAKKVIALARRPGWHAGDTPAAQHIGVGGHPPTHRPPDQVWAEVEMPDDVDWQAEANNRSFINGKDSKYKGELNAEAAQITDELPVGGYYRYKTSPTMDGNWMIGGALKINRVLSDTEAAAVIEEAGAKPDLPRIEGVPRHDTQWDAGLAQDAALTEDDADRDMTAAEIATRVAPPSDIRDSIISKSMITVDDIPDDAIYFPIFADLTTAGDDLRSVDGLPIDPVGLFGGPNFTQMYYYNDSEIVWAFDGEGKATAIVNRVKELQAQNPGKPVIVTVQAMKHDSHTSNATVVAAISRAFEAYLHNDVFSTETLAAADAAIKGSANAATQKHLPGFPGFSDAHALEAWAHEASFDARKALISEMRKSGFRQIPGIFPVERLVRQLVDPDFRDIAPSDTVSMFMVDPDQENLIVDFEDPDTVAAAKAAGSKMVRHPSYQFGLKGTLMGTLKTPLPMSVMYRDLIQQTYDRIGENVLREELDERTKAFKAPLKAEADAVRVKRNEDTAIAKEALKAAREKRKEDVAKVTAKQAALVDGASKEGKAAAREAKKVAITKVKETADAQIADLRAQVDSIKETADATIGELKSRTLPNPESQLEQEEFYKRIAIKEANWTAKYALDRGRKTDHQQMTPELRKELKALEQLGAQRTAMLHTAGLSNTWRPVGQNAASPTEAMLALQESPEAITLSQHSAEELLAKAKDGTLITYQLGDKAVKDGGLNSWIGIDTAYWDGWRNDDGSFFDPGIQALMDEGVLSPTDIGLVGVVNNDGAKGVLQYQALKAIMEGVTVLDAFRVRSSRKPDGLLPTLYGSMGFEEVHEIPFDPSFYTHAEDGTPTPHRMAAIKAVWENQGWRDGVDPMPDLVVMKWRGNDEARSEALRRFVAEGPDGLGISHVEADATGAASERYLRSSTGAGSTTSGVTGTGDGRTDQGGRRDRAGALAAGSRSYAERLTAAQPASLRALNLSEAQVEQIRANHSAALNPDMVEHFQDEVLTKADAAIQAMEENGFVSDEAVMGLLSEYPEYLDGVMEFIGGQAEKLRTGTLTVRDVAKAWAITVTSQQAQAHKLDTFVEREGYTPPNAFIERNMVRPEEAAAQWFGRPEGKAALDAIEQGNFDPALWEGLFQLRRGFGTDITSKALNKQTVRLKSGAIKAAGMDAIAEITDMLNEVGKEGAENFAANVDAVLQKLSFVSSAKGPFMAHLLGMGAVPTMDAVEINYWATGVGHLGSATETQKDVVEGLSQNVDAKRWLRDQVATRFARVAQQLPLPANFDMDVLQHIMHHWLWDRAKGIETTHSGLYEAMANYNSETGPKGMFKQEQDKYGNIQNVITLADGADKSTFLHEMGHFWLYQMKSRLANPKLTEQGRRRLEQQMTATKAWFGRNTNDAWRDIQIIAKGAKANADADPQDAVKRMRAEQLGNAVAHAKRHGGAKYMKDVAAGFMDGSVDYGTALEVGFHELWARGTEAYLFEGRAPSEALRKPMNRFSTWLIGVYGKIKNLNVQLDPEIRDVFDRLLATDAAIHQERSRVLYQIPHELREVATEKELEELDALNAQAQQEARAEMQGRVAKELRKERGAEYAEAKERITAEVTAEIMDRPEYRVIAILSKGVDRDGNVLQPGPPRLDRAAFEAFHGKEAAKKMPRGTFGKKPIMDAAHLAFLADFRDEAHMVAVMTQERPSAAVAIHTEVGRQLLEQFGGVLDPAEIAEVAEEVVQNTKQIELLALQAKIVRRLARGPISKISKRQALEEGAPSAEADKIAASVADTLEGFAETQGDAAPEQLRRVQIEEDTKVNREQRTAQSAAVKQVRQVTRSLDKEGIKEAAKRYVAKLPLGRLTPARFRQTAERLANKAQLAIAARKYDEAADLLQQRTLNLAIAKEVAAAQTSTTNTQRRQRRIVGRPDEKQSRDKDLIAVARLLLDKFGLIGEKRRGMPAEEILARVKEADADLHAEMTELIAVLSGTAEQYREENPDAPWKQMPLEEYTQLSMQIDAILKKALDEASILAEGERIGFEQVADAVKETTADMVPDDRPAKARGAWAERVGMPTLGTIGSRLDRVELWARKIDGGDDGPLQRYLVRPMRLAIDNYHQARNDLSKQMLEILMPVKDDLARKVHIEAAELDDYFFQSKGELIHFLLHTGNASNERKLLLGSAVDVGNQKKYKWTSSTQNDAEVDTAQLDRFITRMISEGVITPTDIKLMNDLWALFEQTKPAAQRAHKEMHGHYFEEIEGTPRVTTAGTLTGGYVPAIYDNRQITDGQKREAVESMDSAQSAAMFPSTDAGFTKGRVDYNQPLNLDLGLIPMHLNKVLRFSHLGPAVRMASRLTINKAFQAAVGRVDRYAIANLITPWLQRTARQTIAEPGIGFLDRIYTRASRNVGLQTMAGNFLNAAQQMTGLITASAVVPASLIAKHTVMWRKDGQNVRKFIISKSRFMNNRMYDSVNDMSATVGSILTATTPWAKADYYAGRFGYIAQQIAQNMVDPIVWMAAYDQAVETTYYQNVYNQYLQTHGRQTALERADAAAVLYADRVVRDTQTPLGPEDVSAAEGTSAFGRLFMKFGAYFNNMRGLSKTEFKIAARNLGTEAERPGRRFMIYLTVIAMPSIVAEGIMMLGRGEFDDMDDMDEEEITILLGKLLILSQVKMVGNFVPGVGTAVNWGIGQFTDVMYDDRLSASPVLSIVEGGGKSLANVAVDAYELATEQETSRSVARSVADILNAFGLIFGLPTNWFKKPASYLIKVSEGEARPDGPADIVEGLLSGRDGTEKK